MLPEMLKMKLSSLFNNALFFIVILFVLFVVYAFSERKKGPLPKLFDIREILYGYYQIFKKKKDFFYLLAVVSLLARITILLSLETDKSFSQISVILSLLVSAIIGLIPMALSKGDNIQEWKWTNCLQNTALCITEEALCRQKREFNKLYNSHRNLFLDKCYGESKTPLGEWMDFSEEKDT